MRGGALNWTDEGTAPVARLGLHDLTLDVADIAIPFAQPMQFAGSVSVTSLDAARLSFRGSATDRVANVNATIADLPLTLAAPYLAQIMTPGLSGVLNAELGVSWKAGADGVSPAELLLDAPQLSLDTLALTQGKTRLASMKKLLIERAQVNMTSQTVTLDKLELTQPKIGLWRDADGRWMVESWLKTASNTATDKQPAAKPWGVAIQYLALQGGEVNFVDQSVSKPVAFDLSALSVKLKNFATTDVKPFLADVSTQMRVGRGEAAGLARQCGFESAGSSGAGGCGQAAGACV